MGQGRPPLERLKLYFEINADTACEGQFKVGCFLGNMCQEMSDSSDSIRLKVRQVLRKITLLIEDVLDEAKQKGDLPEDKNTQLIAEFLVKCRDPLDAFLTMMPLVLE